LPIVPGFRFAEILRKAGNLIDETQVQPAGVDLTLLKVFKFSSTGSLNKATVNLPNYTEVQSQDGFFRLPAGAYKIRFKEIVEIPSDCVGIAFPRSSLLRMGVTINLAVWDPGYRGRGEALLVVFNEYGVILEQGARIAQLMLMKLAEKPHTTYKGRYLHENI